MIFRSRNSLVQAVAAFVLAALISGAAQAQHVLNLKDADIEVLVSTVAEMTGKTFVVDPRVTGEVTVISSTPLDADGIYSLFQSVLRVHGYATVPSGSATKIVPETQAQTDSIPTATTQDLAPDDLVTRIVKIEHVPAADVVNVIKSMMPAQAQVSAYAPANLLILADRAGNLDRVLSIVKRIDSAADQQIEAIRLEHSSAAEVVRTLNLLSGSGGEESRIVADERTNTILLGGDPSSRLRMRSLIAHLDTPLESGEQTQVVYLNYASAESLLPILEGVARGGKEGEDSGDDVSVHAHPETNALVVSAPPARFRELAEIIRRLDIRRAQVLVEAVIAEVSVDFINELGVQWQIASDDSNAVGGTNFAGSNNILGASVNPLAVGPGLNLGYLAGTASIPGLDGEVLQLGALVSALESDTDSDVLSTPSIVTLDNEEAQIQVGQEVPFLTGQFSNTGSSGGAVNPFQTIERKEIGLTLTVTPHINQGDSIILDIQQEVSSLSNTSGAVDLVTNKRTLTTSVMVSDNATLVLGGLIDEDVEETVQKVPALGDIPLLGNLFKYRVTKRTRRNLMIFIRPRILSDPGLADYVTGAKYNYIREEQRRAQQGYSGLEPEQLPILPTLEQPSNQDGGQ
ncbi:MAG: type II secretion system protein GspD [Lysobacteraceae bacterium]|nr:MAG: type II secretion system protein GspD [Xanthomonadaceae bacterium]